MSPAQRAWRWCRRNPVIAGLGIALVASLVIGFVGMGLLYLQAEDRRELAETERGKAVLAQAKEQQSARDALLRKQEAEAASRKAEEEGADFEAVALFLIEHLLKPPANYPNRKEITLLAAVDAAAPKVEEACKGRPLVEAALHHNLGETYRILTEFDKAERHLQRAWQLRREHLGAEHQKTVSSLHNLVNLMVDRGKLREAEPLYRQLLEQMRQAHGPAHDRTLIVQNNLSTVLEKLNQLDEAAQLLEEVCRHRRATLGLEHTITQTAMNNLVALQQSRNKLKEAAETLDELLEVLQRQLPPDNPRLLLAQMQLGTLQFRRREFPAAVAQFRKVEQAQRRSLSADHPNLLLTQNNLGIALINAGNLDEAEQVLRDTLPKHETKLSPTHPQTLSVVHNLGTLYRERGDWTAMEQAMRRAYEGRRQRYTATHPDVLYAQYGLGLALYKLGKPAEAVPLLRDYIQKAQGIKNWPNSQLLSAIGLLGDSYTSLGKFPEAQNMLLQAEKYLKEITSPDFVPYRRDNCQWLIRLYRQWNKPDQAAKWQELLETLPSATSKH